MNDRTVLKFATWNIGGGILGESHQENGQPTLDYHIALIKQHEPDIICLQEAHSYDGQREGQVEYIARHAGYPHVVSYPISPSHMDKEAYLSLGILSRYPIKNPTYKQFPNPGLSSTGPHGAKWILFDKGYVESIIDLGTRTLGLVNAHCFPLHYFGAKPTEPRFASMWEMLAVDLLGMAKLSPTLAAIDLNYEPIEELLGRVLSPQEYLNAFEDTPTIPKGTQQDYIIYDHTLQLITTLVKPTSADHSYCQVAMMV
jgi:endonuclease/exonuclease/phosphatase family metal-dependent hydrolase